MFLFRRRPICVMKNSFCWTFLLLWIFVWNVTPKNSFQGASFESVMFIEGRGFISYSRSYASRLFMTYSPAVWQLRYFRLRSREVCGKCSNARLVFVPLLDVVYRLQATFDSWSSRPFSRGLLSIVNCRSRRLSIVVVVVWRRSMSVLVRMFVFRINSVVKDRTLSDTRASVAGWLG